MTDPYTSINAKNEIDHLRERLNLCEQLVLYLMEVIERTASPEQLEMLDEIGRGWDDAREEQQSNDPKDWRA